ncbi:hypothetical protein HPB51_014418 [Rhipicephalus microplus]|uniref:Uncharacterized protein n=1 Tax=Rhipicephalus microplus TaxID=6941 RepID=A0A9J6F378_RHIMP|nr:hypothetical protein HPB51_014418 [Rhipicephalus microplus]
MSAHAKQQWALRRKLKDSIEEPIAEVQDEDLFSSGDEMVCDLELISVADSAATDAVFLLQRYFEHDGGTEFLSSLSAMHSYNVLATNPLLADNPQLQEQMRRMMPQFLQQLQNPEVQGLITNPQALQQPPEERYRSQLEQLVSMGFVNREGQSARVELA